MTTLTVLCRDVIDLTCFIPSCGSVPGFAACRRTKECQAHTLLDASVLLSRWPPLPNHSWQCHSGALFAQERRWHARVPSKHDSPYALLSYTTPGVRWPQRRRVIFSACTRPAVHGPTPRQQMLILGRRIHERVLPAPKQKWEAATKRKREWC